MTKSLPRMIIIGGGIAGLCAGVYAQRSGFQAVVLEQHEQPGGLATSWQRGGYRFETCLHWLVGSKPGAMLNGLWREVCDIDSLRFVDNDVFVRCEDGAESLTLYTDPDRLERELLRLAPQDEEAARHFISAIRHLAALPVPNPGDPWPIVLGDVVRILPDVPLLWSLAHVSAADYGLRFSHPLIQRFFSDGATGRLSVLALMFSLAWMSTGNARYAIGGSQALIRAVVARLTELGGEVRCKARVQRIIVEQGRVRGVMLESGDALTATAVISAADGHSTLQTMLGGRYRSEASDTAYEAFETFPSYVQVSLGVARDLSDLPGFMTLGLDTPLVVDAANRLTSLSCRIFHFDPTFAPPGKTAMTVFLPTYGTDLWCRMREDDPHAYVAAKHALAAEVIERLDHRIPGLRDAVEVTDVSTPATVVRYTGNWKGSMEGWLMTPATGLTALPQILPGLSGFAMAGHWVQPGGGLPAGLMTARSAVEILCRELEEPFMERKPLAEASA